MVVDLLSFRPLIIGHKSGSIMTNLIETSIALGKLLDIVLAYKPGLWGKVSIPGFWAYTTTGAGGRGPMAFYDRSLQRIPDSDLRDFDQDIECLNFFAEFLASEPSLTFSRKVLDDGFLANRLEMSIFPDRTVELAWSFDAEVDKLQLQEAKKYMSKEEIAEAEVELAEYFEFKGRSRRMRRVEPESKEMPPPPSPASVNAPISWTVPELFQAIVNTLVGAAPDGWTKLVIDGQVWVETDASGRALNNVSADFQAQMADGSVRKINPEQPIAAMNALTLLQKQLPNLEGKSWRRLRVSFDNAVPKQVAYEFDQAGLWRPGSQ